MNENIKLCPFVLIIFSLEQKKTELIQQKSNEFHLQAPIVCVLVDFDGFNSTSDI